MYNYEKCKMFYDINLNWHFWKSLQKITKICFIPSKVVWKKSRHTCIITIKGVIKKFMQNLNDYNVTDYCCPDHLHWERWIEILECNFPNVGALKFDGNLCLNFLPAFLYWRVLLMTVILPEVATEDFVQFRLPHTCI